MNITLSLEPTFFGPFVSSSLCVFGFVHCQYRESGVASFPGAPLPPKADQRQEEVGPECATTHPGPSQPSAHPRPSGEPSGLRPGNGTEVQKGGGKEDSFTIYHFSRRATFYLPCNDASNQTIKTIGIDMQLQDLAFESPIWQDPLYVLKARSLHPLDTPKTLTVHHDINRRM